MSTVLFGSLASWWPELILSAGALLTILVGVCSAGSRPVMVAAWGSLIASAIALRGAPVLPSAGLFLGVVICDPFSLVFRWFALGTIALVLLLVMGSREAVASDRGECAGLLLFLGLGLMLMAQANHLLMAYVAIELVSLSSYALVGFLHDQRSAEASLKYLLYGALSSGIMLFGMSLLFGLTGALAFPELLRAVAALAPGMHSALLMAVTLMLVGLAFKISIVPFHMWTPDAYEGAPVPITALLSVGPKAAALALLVRLMHALAPAWPALAPLVLGLTIITMTLGNVVALVQTNIKRLLAYSTIGQAGYLLIGFAVNTRAGLGALLVYLVAYLFMNLGVFACVVAVVDEAQDESLEAFRGLSARAPALALCGAVFLLSLAGMPPLFGFLGKFLLFESALGAGQRWLALAAILNSAIALYYYVNLIRLMYFVTPSAHAQPLRAGAPLRLALGVCLASTLLLGLFPGPLLNWLGNATTVTLL